MKVSSVVLSTQLQPAAKGKTDNPLVRDGVQLLPNLTHVVGKDQKLYFYYEVYDPRPGQRPRRSCGRAWRSIAARSRCSKRRSSSGRRSTSADRHAALFQFEVPADSFTPGLYTCQINIVDTVAGKFDFPRMLFAVR